MDRPRYSVSSTATITTPHLHDHQHHHAALTTSTTTPHGHDHRHHNDDDHHDRYRDHTSDVDDPLQTTARSSWDGSRSHAIHREGKEHTKWCKW